MSAGRDGSVGHGAGVDETGGVPRPLLLHLAAGLMCLQGAVLVALGVFLAVRGFGSDTSSRGRAELGAVLAVLGGAGFVMLARAAMRRRSWARSPTMVIEFLCLPVAAGLLQAHRYVYGIPLIIVPVATMVLLGLAGAFAVAD